MGEQLLRNFSKFRTDIDRLDQSAQRLGFPSVRPLIEASDHQIDESDPVSAQLAILLFENALYRLWISWGVHPNCVLGHSLGQYAALNAAGVISDADTIYLVGRRAQLLKDKCKIGTHSMLAVRASAQEVQPYTEGSSCEFACFNSIKDSVISGESHAIHEIRQRLSNSSIKATELSVPLAYHSIQVEPILADLERLASGVSFHKPSVPVICLLQGQVVMDCGTFGPRYLASHCRNPVDMISGLNAAQTTQILDENTITLEIGPQPVVSAMIKASLGQQMQTFVSSQRG